MEKQKKRNHKGSFGKLFGAIVLTAVLLFLVGGSIVFRVHKVEISGSEQYTEEEILTISGVDMGDHLFFISPSKISATLISELSYARAVQVSRRLPDTLVIQITEAIPVATVIANGEWVIDKNCKVLEKVSGSSKENLIPISGLELAQPEIGEEISQDGTEEITAELVSNILTALVNREMVQDVTALDAEGTAYFTFLYDDRLKVILGSAVDADEKLALMEQVLQELETDAAGTLDLSVEGEARYIPDLEEK